jgi:PAS domain S-box-containing protein
MYTLNDFTDVRTIHAASGKTILEARIRDQEEIYRITIEPTGQQQQLLPDIVNEELKARIDLARKERYFRTIIDKSFDVILICNEEGGINYISPSSKAELGYFPNELTGKQAKMLLPEAETERFANWLNRVLDEPSKVLRRRTRFCTKEMETLHVEIIFKNLLDDEAIDGILIMVRDISEAIEAEEILTNYNNKLKEEVALHTGALQEKNDELETLLANLKEAQVQLIESEKLASLGQLTAGIAHEINNPINFVSANIGPLKRDIADIRLLLEKYASLHTCEDLEQNLEEIQQLRESLDIDYLEEEITQLLNGIEEGATRTSEIVAGLRSFSRIDEEDIKPADLHEGLNSTLMLLSHKLRMGIHVSKQFAENLPQVECYPGKINQVFMNILSNSVQALDGKGSITLRTWHQDDTVFISIKDNGPGISDEDKEKVFEPFFTTKPSGEGTGLGLSITNAIIQKHKGNIEIHSQPGKGAEFVISLPVKFREAKSNG